MNFWCLRGANSDTQWYWPPLVGALRDGEKMMCWIVCTRRVLRQVGDAYMEAISAMDRLTSMKPVQQMKYIQIVPAVPPLMRPMVDTLDVTMRLAKTWTLKVLELLEGVCT